MGRAGLGVEAVEVVQQLAQVFPANDAALRVDAGLPLVGGIAESLKGAGEDHGFCP